MKIKSNILRGSVALLCGIVAIYSCTKEPAIEPSAKPDPSVVLADYNANFTQSLSPNPRAVEGGSERGVLLAVCDGMGAYEGGSIGWRASSLVPIPQVKLAAVGFGALWGGIAATWAAAGAPGLTLPPNNPPNNGNNPFFEVGVLHNQHIHHLISNNYSFGSGGTIDPATNQYILANSYPGLSPAETQQMYTEMEADFIRIYNFYSGVQVYADVQAYINSLEVDAYTKDFLLSSSGTIMNYQMTAEQVRDYTDGLENLVLQSGFGDEQAWPLLTYISVLRESAIFWKSQDLDGAE